MKTFKDNFSKQAEVYSKFRPTYPKELFEYLQSLTAEHKYAWDCGTGNGQSAVELALFYDQVYATDPSEEQIKNAIRNPKINYKVEKAENPALDDKSVDLITVAQAVHWFDFDKFYPEVKRVLKGDGIIAVWAYGLPRVNKELDQIIKDFHDNIVGEFWLPENRLIEKNYTTIPFPFEEVISPAFFIKKKMNLPELLGHFRSWSAMQKYIDTYKENPIEPLKEKMSKFWREEEKEIVWDLILRVGKNISS